MMDALHRISRDPLGLLGLILVVLIIASALLAGLIAPYDPIKLNIIDRLQGPSVDHLLGTESFFLSGSFQAHVLLQMLGRTQDVWGC